VLVNHSIGKTIWNCFHATTRDAIPSVRPIRADWSLTMATSERDSISSFQNNEGLRRSPVQVKLHEKVITSLEIRPFVRTADRAVCDLKRDFNLNRPNGWPKVNQICDVLNVLTDFLFDPILHHSLWEWFYIDHNLFENSWTCATGRHLRNPKVSGIIWERWKEWETSV
jgi:hypothetical protein